MTIAELEQTYIDDLNTLGDWFLEYEYLLRIAKDLPALREGEHTDANKVKGCQSGVWLGLSFENGLVRVRADSDALIIRGMISIIVSLLDDRTPQEILDYRPRYLEETNLSREITQDRFNGMHAVIRSIQDYAQKCLTGENT